MFQASSSRKWHISVLRMDTGFLRLLVDITWMK